MKLSNREREILYLISMEKTNIEIAESLYLSLETIRTHRKNIMGKLSAVNTAGMIRRAFETGVLGVFYQSQRSLVQV
ncbi:MAG: helix-turn-helix transcriptional regulator [Saprospiraceae bacterium]|nr:helix-turn-helix transcriptional regulator [Saprospiraceae bacterium]